ncbi:hypothetical protein TeGR_g9806, partial [Tetraparma gracilis]
DYASSLCLNVTSHLSRSLVSLSSSLLSSLLSSPRHRAVALAEAEKHAPKIVLCAPAAVARGSTEVVDLLAALAESGLPAVLSVLRRSLATLSLSEFVSWQYPQMASWSVAETAGVWELLCCHVAVSSLEARELDPACGEVARFAGRAAAEQPLPRPVLRALEAGLSAALDAAVFVADCCPPPASEAAAERHAELLAAAELLPFDPPLSRSHALLSTPAPQTSFTPVMSRRPSQVDSAFPDVFAAMSAAASPTAAPP